MMPRSLSALLPLIACVVGACNIASALDRKVASIVISAGDREFTELVPGVVRFFNDKYIERIGEPVSQLITAEVRNADGRPVPGIELTATTSDDGSVRAVDAAGNMLDGAAITDRQGRATFAWTLGWMVGEQSLTIGAPDSKYVVVTTGPSLPLDAVVTLALADSVLSIGDSTLASATITTTTGRVIDYPYEMDWFTSDPAVATVRASAIRRPEPERGRSPITVTGVSPGRARISVGVGMPIHLGSHQTRIAYANVAVVGDQSAAAPRAP